MLLTCPAGVVGGANQIVKGQLWLVVRDVVLLHDGDDNGTLYPGESVPFDLYLTCY